MSQGGGLAGVWITPRLCSCSTALELCVGKAITEPPGKSLWLPRTYFFFSARQGEISISFVGQFTNLDRS